jgi:hypothetical protein
MRKQRIGIGRNSSEGIRRLTSVGIVVALLALVTTAAVSLRSSQAKDSAARATSLATSANSLRANAQQTSFVPQTGQVRPLTQEEAQKLAEGIKQIINQSTDGLKNVNHPDGSVSIDLEGRFQSVAVAKRDEDGTLIESCVDNRQAAAAFFGIDPQLVGVPLNTVAPKTGSSVSEKGGNR